MTGNYSIALVLVRFLGVIYLVAGLVSLLLGAITVAAAAMRASEWFIGSLMTDMARSIVLGPLELLFGAALLVFSRPLAKIVAKFGLPE